MASLVNGERRVIAHLEKAITTEGVPSWLHRNEQNEVVKGLVNEAVKPYRDEQEREQQRQRHKIEAERQVADLIQHGKSYGDEQVRDWDLSSKWGAQRELEAELRTEVKADCKR